jgi:hypothetical protein
VLALVPELVLASPGEHERLLPDAADGEVEVWAGNDGFEAYGYTAGGRYWAHLPGTASFQFQREHSNVVAIPEDGVSRHLVEDVYRRNILPLVLQLRGHEVLHASAVCTESGLLVLCGVSGTGKSTFAYHLSKRGHALWADDAVALELDDASPIALQLPFQLGLRSEMEEFAPHERREFAEIAIRSDVRAILTLNRAERIDLPLAQVVRLDPTIAFVALLPHAYYFRLADTRRNALMLDRYLRVASSVPIFEVNFRPGLRNVSTVLDAIERRVLGVVT